MPEWSIIIGNRRLGREKQGNFIYTAYFMLKAILGVLQIKYKQK